MGWTLSYLKPFKPALIDSLLLTSGKALHLANLFEEKCGFVLQFFKLGTYLIEHPGVDLPNAVASLSKEKLLGQKIKRLKLFPEVKPNEVLALEKARDARNFIAHEGAAFGYIFRTNEKSIRDHVLKLHIAVGDLILGDNLISGWVYEIEEKEPAPNGFAEIYPEMVKKWVFDDIEKRLKIKSNRRRRDHRE